MLHLYLPRAYNAPLGGALVCSYGTVRSLDSEYYGYYGYRNHLKCWNRTYIVWHSSTVFFFFFVFFFLFIFYFDSFINM